jgi:hypothetical protein
MSAPIDPQPVDPQGFIDYEDYEFVGNSGTLLNKRKFLEGLRLKASIYHAAQYAGVGRTTVYRWLDQDQVFAQAVADAADDAGDKLETSVYERAFTDNLLAMFWLKAHRHKFRDKTTIDITVVQSEIAERMKQVGLVQLPGMATEFIPAGYQGEEGQPVAIPSPVPQTAKREAE